MSYARVFQINVMKGSFLPKSSISRSFNILNHLSRTQNYAYNKQIRMYSRRARYQLVEPNFYNSFLKPTLFVVGGVGVTYTAAMIASEEKTKRAMKKFPAFFNRGMRQMEYGVSWNDIWRQYELIIRTKCQRENNIISKIKAWWLSIEPEYRCLAPIVALNCLVYLLWKVPRCNAFLSRYFLCRASSPCSSLLFSTFSHQAGWHLCANMIGLVSFGRFIVSDLGNEQFYAFYLSSGMIASYVSYLAKFLLKTTSVASLGASGAVFAVTALAIRSMPNISVSLIFLPFLPISGNVALLCTTIFETVGLFSRKTAFDHPAHLGGMAVGYFYYPIHELLWVKYRRWLITHYRKIRSWHVSFNKQQ